MAIPASGPSSRYQNNTALPKGSIPASGPGQQYGLNTLRLPGSQQYVGPTSGGGGGGGGGGSVGSSVYQDPNFGDSMNYSYPSAEAFLSAIDNVYGDQNSYLDQAEAQLKTDRGVAEGQVQGNYDVNKQLAGTALSNANTQIGQQETTGNRATEDALSKARRIFNEQNIGSQQRFGGSSSAGQASSELLSRQLLTDQGQTQRQHGDFLQQIGSLKQQAQQKFDDGMLKLEQTKQNALSQVQSDFQNKLLQIQGDRTQLATAKAQARLQALMDLRNQTFAIQQQNQQFQQALQLQSAASGKAIDQYAQQAQGYGQTAQTAGNALTSNYNNTNYGLATNSTNGQTSGNQYVGYAQQLTPKRDNNNFNVGSNVFA